MSKKAFFSVAILVFAVIILLFFVNVRQDTKPLVFDDSPRYFALKVEEAYASFDKNLSYAYIDYKLKYVKDCNASAFDPNGYYAYFLKTPILIDKICVFAGITVSSNYNKSNSSNDVNFVVLQQCFLDLNKEGIREQYTYSQQLTFRKQYKSFEDNGKCHFILTDLDADKVYVDIIK